VFVKDKIFMELIVTATVVLCMLSTLSFCLCLRGLVGVMATGRIRSGNYSQHFGGFSGRARRVARQYATFSLVVLGMASLLGAVRSFLELFT
jgi:hypothetical protein